MLFADDILVAPTLAHKNESKFNIHGSDGHQKVWRKTNAALEPKNMRGTVKHGGGSIMLDNDGPKHTARVVREWLLYNVRKQVKNPLQSPDLNPIEHLWDYLDRQIRKQEIKTKNDLKKSPFGGVVENTIFCHSKFAKISAI
ncbi:transposable element Tcb1 transposase [Trichonephila clavipes]|nr:transposable element Tcb1 transposase [Trichonephila clavipes]